MTALDAILTRMLQWMLQWTSVAYAKPPKEQIASPAQPPGTLPGGGDPPMADINDIKPILDLGHDWQWLIYLVAATTVLLGLLALAWWLWKRRKPSETALPAAPPVAPDVEAYEQLEALAAENGLDPKQFYFRLSAILRHYIERRFDFPAAEMTTEELLPKVDRLPLNNHLANEFKAFCRKTDPIKFAGAIARQDRLAQDLAFSRSFVHQTTTAAQALEEDQMRDEETNELPKVGLRDETR